MRPAKLTASETLQMIEEFNQFLASKGSKLLLTPGREVNGGYKSEPDSEPRA